MAISSSCTDMDDLKTLLSEQRRELASAQTLESDLNLAFDLQMQEAVTASLALRPSSSSSSPSSKLEAEPATFVLDDDEGLSFAALVAEEVGRLEQVCRDREVSEAEMRKMREDLNRRIHDQKLASDIMRIPEAEWRKDGDNYERPYFEGSGQRKVMVDDEESFTVYVKGMVGEERVRDSKVFVAAIGLAICDSKDNLIFELRKPLVDGEDKSLMSGVEVGIKALIEGLNAAIALDLKRVSCFCDEYLIHQYVTERLPPTTPSKISKLITDVMLLRTKFANFTLSLVARNNIKFAIKFARDAIVSQITWALETDRGNNLMETCVICFEDTVADKMFSVDGCFHRFCFSCMKQHVEVKLLNGEMAKCPNEGCNREVNVDTCEEFLDPKLIEIMRQRSKEASVPVTEKVYCPYPKCSVLMSKREVLENTNNVLAGAEQSSVRKCTKCQGFFCINCKVPWHNNMTCLNYKRSNPHHFAEDAKLKSLATKKLWRQCVKCNHMIELSQGCYHINCRCGYEFCYTCGAEWIKKKPTCTCPLWAEPNIIYNNKRRRVNFI